MLTSLNEVSKQLLAMSKPSNSAAPSLNRPEHLRCILVLLANPLWLEPPSHEALAQVMRALLHLSAHMRQSLRKSLRNVPNNMFSVMISVF